MTLADRIAGLLEATGRELLVEEIARTLKARTSEVRRTLHDDSRFSSRERGAYTSDRAQVWSTASTTPDAPGRPGTAGGVTQCDRLLAILRDGGWYSSKELHQKVYCVLHSRIAELRQRGHVIEHRVVRSVPLQRDERNQFFAPGGRESERHEYRLVSTLEQRSARPAACADGIPYRASSLRVATGRCSNVETDAVGAKASGVVPPVSGHQTWPSAARLRSSGGTILDRDGYKLAARYHEEAA